MLEQAFNEVYTKFKLHFYRSVFGRFQKREASLTTVETFCMEIIMALGKPTVNEFSSFVGISAPNAAYKINNLVKKGYVVRQRSEEDRRVVYILLTDKGVRAYRHHEQFHHEMIEAVVKNLDSEEKDILIQALVRLKNFFVDYKARHDA